MKQYGFTLVELLIAITILSVIGVISYGALDGTLKHQTAQKHHSQNLTQLQRISLYLDRDFSQVFQGEVTLSKDKIQLKSVQNDTLLTIDYQFGDNTITRHATSSIGKSAKLIFLKEVKEFKIRLLDNKNKWHTTWKFKNNKNRLKAIEVKFTHPYWGDIKKVVAI
ncbi:general secretion pathway protein J [Bathymodiolus thermophilus thioautotrophic gill symbiont]|uniref:Type II secretion system protein J n=1 Tax=Bathymodiolus thermophilus thioautotrophic gill symbiont TaxID=2360 RepID=A0A3G3IL29_9GAMM|nr:prepilin-type N-terminal cleavage/methylation domain-containing protein [Bathymodiolus thermophilus thioautotrophic gill symbiont]AYQ56481.1 general secretion pathway protein J [Bathymodiolus thermophilus thioautotrophic gill symbiont]